jgi:hypothetical protein
MENIGTKEFRVYTKLSDLVFAFGSKVIIITNGSQDAPRGVNVQHEFDGRLLKFYVSNPKEFDQVLKVYGHDNRHLKSYIPINDFCDSHKPIVEIFDLPDDEGVGVELKSISEKDFRNIVDPLENDPNDTSRVLPTWVFPLFVIVAIVLFAYLNLHR